MVKKVVIKLGTGILSAGKGKIHEARLAKLANGIHAVGKSSKTQVIVVSSGAVGLGMGKLGLDSRPTDLAILRACAAIGQCLLMNAWTDALRHVGLVSAQEKVHFRLVRAPAWPQRHVAAAHKRTSNTSRLVGSPSAAHTAGGTPACSRHSR